MRFHCCHATCYLQHDFALVICARRLRLDLRCGIILIVYRCGAAPTQVSEAANPKPVGWSRGPAKYSLSQRASSQVLLPVLTDGTCRDTWHGR